MLSLLCGASFLLTSAQAQQFSGRAALRPQGVLRLGEQPAALLREQQADWAFFSVGLAMGSHLFDVQLPAKVSYAGSVLSKRPLQTTHYALQLQGPALSIPLDAVSVLALSLQYRMQGQASLERQLHHDIQTEFSDSETYELRRSDTHAAISMAQWYDLQLAYARILGRSGSGQWQMGWSGHLLLGNGAMQVEVPQLSYLLAASNVLFVESYRWHARYSPGYAAHEQGSAYWRPRAVGVGLDMGLLWQRKPKAADPDRWQLEMAGLSLLDLGSIRFGKGSLQYQEISRGLHERVELDQLMEQPAGLLGIQDSLAQRLGISARQEKMRLSLPFRARAEVMLAYQDWQLMGVAELDLHAWMQGDIRLQQFGRIQLSPVYRLQDWTFAFPQQWSAAYGMQHGLSLSRGGFSLGFSDIKALISQEQAPERMGLWLSWHKSFRQSDEVLCP
jgi:hypothetical protein